MPRTGAGRRYAEAAFVLAERDRAVDAWGRDLVFAAALSRDENVTRLVDSPALPFAQRRAAVERLLEAKVSPGALNLALLLAQRGRFSILPTVRAEYDALVRNARGIVAATVTTPTALSDAQLARIRTRVEELAGAEVELHTATDPALLGGLTISIGDRFIDASVRGRLDRLRGQLVHGTS